MKRRFIGRTDPGLVRSVNQDYHYIDSEGKFFIVADGMGGHAGGQEASRIATKTIQAYLDQHWDSPIPSAILLKNAIYQANQSILEDQYHHPDRGDMGTTLVMIIFREDKPWCAHIGDSRFYRLRNSQLEQITEDHTWVAKAIKSGDLTKEQVKTHPWRHILSQCLGRQDLSEIDIDTFSLEPGDILLLCSDGLTEELPDEFISRFLQAQKTCEETAQDLIDAAKQAGGSDNITVIIVAQD